MDEKELKKWMLALIKELILFLIKDALMTEFIKQELQIKYEEEIEAWLIYLDQQKFGKKLEKQMLREIERFISTRKTVDEIIVETFKKPEWEKMFIEDIPANYVFKSMLGYS